PNDPLAQRLVHGQQGLPVFVLALNDLLNGAGPESAHRVGWGFLAGSARGPAIAAQVTTPEPGKAPKLTSFSRGSEVALVIRAIHEAQSLPQAQENDYDVQILRVPAALIEALWLKPRTQGADLLVPFHTRSRH